VVIYDVLPNIGPQYRTQETKKYTLHFQIPAGVQFKRSRPSRVSPTKLRWACQNVSHVQLLVANFFPTPPIKLKLGLQVSGRLLIATHLDESDYLANQKQWFDCVYETDPGLWKLRALEAEVIFKVPLVLQLIHWWTSSKISRAGSHTERWWRCCNGVVCNEIYWLLCNSKFKP